jgi:hypothetical protein
MPHPTMIACGLSLPHRSKMGLTGLKYGRKLMKGMGAYKKDMSGGMMPPRTRPPMTIQPAPTRTLKFR